MKARLVYENESVKLVDVNITSENDVMIATLSKEEVGEGVKHVDFMYDFFNTKAGDEGYFITDAEVNGTMMTKFTERNDCERVQIFSFVSCYGWNKGKDGILGIVTGMRYDMTMVLGIKDGLYYTYPRILTEGDMPYEDIKIEYYTLEDATYSKMACFYRDYQINRCGCIPLKERVKDDARLKKVQNQLQFVFVMAGSLFQALLNIKRPKQNLKCMLHATLTEPVILLTNSKNTALKMQNSAL